MSNNFYFIAGASGSGKTSIMPHLKSTLEDTVTVHDFDEIGVPENADTKWRQEATELWLQKLLKEGKEAVLLGQIVLGEILACPSAKLLGKINFCLLDVNDFERVARLRRRNTHGTDQHMLNWAAWLRMHHYDPQWMQQVLKEDCWHLLDFSTWDRLLKWDSKAHTYYLDTTRLSIDQVAEHVTNWITTVSTEEPLQAIPGTPYTLEKNVKNAFEIIDTKISAYVTQCVPATQTPEIIDKRYVIKENDTIVAGICADIYTWKILYISLLFVDETHRNKGLGSFLLSKIEEEATAFGVKLIHTDTFDFLAKDFYLKQGYEIFGVLDNCPGDHKRYYLKKVL